MPHSLNCSMEIRHMHQQFENQNNMEILVGRNFLFIYAKLFPYMIRCPFSDFYWGDEGSIHRLVDIGPIPPSSNFVFVPNQLPSLLTRWPEMTWNDPSLHAKIGPEWRGEMGSTKPPGSFICYFVFFNIAKGINFLIARCSHGQPNKKSLLR